MQFLLGILLLIAYFIYLGVSAEDRETPREQSSRLAQRQAQRRQQEIEDWEDAHFL